MSVESFMGLGVLVGLVGLVGENSGFSGFSGFGVKILNVSKSYRAF